MADLSNENLLRLMTEAHLAGNTTSELAATFVDLVGRCAGKDAWHHLTKQSDIKTAALFQLTNQWRNFNFAKSQTPYPYLHTIVMRAFTGVSFSENQWAEIREGAMYE